MRQPSVARIDQYPARAQQKRAAAQAEPPRLALGDVLAVADGAAEVRIEGRDVQARRAPSCLIAPLSGDVALVSLCGSRDGRTDPVIIAILERAPQQPAVLHVPGASDVTVAAPALTLAASGRVGIQAEECRIEATRTTIRGRVLQLIADALSSVAARLSLSAGRMESSADTAAEVYGQRTSVVQGVETRSAGSLTIKVDHVMAVRTADALVAAQKDIRMDAERISLG
jgi:hypothetical protein